MKTLLVLRHAKAKSDAPDGDHARELTGRGRRNAAAVGAHMRSLTGAPDAIVTSDARRALQTAEIMADALGFTAPLTVEPRIYGAHVATLISVVHDLPADAAAVLLVGHNPGLEDLVARLTGDDPDDIRLPTAALARLSLDVDRWDQAQEGTARLQQIVTPRELG
jgi:phosphohistidine phosphatase